LADILPRPRRTVENDEAEEPDLPSRPSFEDTAQSIYDMPFLLRRTFRADSSKRQAGSILSRQIDRSTQVRLHGGTPFSLLHCARSDAAHTLSQPMRDQTLVRFLSRSDMRMQLHRIGQRAQRARLDHPTLLHKKP